MKKVRRPWWLLVFVPLLVICMLFGAGGGSICAGGVKLASMIDGLEASVDPDGMISLAKGTGLDREVLNILHPKGERQGRDIYALDPSCGASSTLVERVAQQEGWMSGEEAAGLAKFAPFLGIVLLFGFLAIGFVSLRRRHSFAT